METYPTTHDANQGEKTGFRSVDHSSIPKDLEGSVRNKVFDMEQSHVPTHAMVVRSVEDNIEEILLQKFDAESDGEIAKANEKDSQKFISEDHPAQPLPSLAWKEKKNWSHVQATRMSSRIQFRVMGDLLLRKFRNSRSQKIWKSQKVIRFMGFLILLLLLRTKFYLKKLNLLALALAISL
jgi:hypothetical protein